MIRMRWYFTLPDLQEKLNGLLEEFFRSRCETISVFSEPACDHNRGIGMAGNARLPLGKVVEANCSNIVELIWPDDSRSGGMK